MKCGALPIALEDEGDAELPTRVGSSIKNWGGKGLQGKSCVGMSFTAGDSLGNGLLLVLGVLQVMLGREELYPSQLQKMYRKAAIPEISAQGLVLIYTHLALNLCWYKCLWKAAENKDNFLEVQNWVIEQLRVMIRKSWLVLEMHFLFHLSGTQARRCHAVGAGTVPHSQAVCYVVFCHQLNPLLKQGLGLCL